MEEKIYLPKRWIKKLDSKTRILIDENENAFGDILDHELFFFPEYTNHKIMHINHIMRISEKLVPKVCDKFLTAEDIMCYVIAVLYHDIGMHITYEGFLRMIREGCLDGEHREVYGDPKWEQLWNQYILEAKLWDEKKRKDILGDPDGIQKLHVLKNVNELYVDFAKLNYYDRIFTGEFLRRHHCRLAYDIACMGFPTAEKNILTLPAEWKRIIGHIARSHGENIWKMSDLVKKQYGSNFRKYRGTHILYFMVLLRIADYFDISEERASINIFHLFHFISPVSAKEWKKNQIVQGVCFHVVNDPEVLFIETSPPDNSGLFLEMKKLLEDMQRELDVSWAVLGDTYGNFPDKLQLSIRRIKSDLLDFRSEGHSVAYLSEPIKFRANASILKLMVRPLYNDSPEFGIRELLQNAIDACKEKQELCQSAGEPYHGQIIVEAVYLDDGRIRIGVTDNGIGMSKDVIKNYYLVAGASFRRDPLWKEKFMIPDEQRTRISRNGRFGIGVLATYLLGDEVHVETTSYMEHTTYMFDAVLDADQLDVYKKSHTDKESGTTVSVRVTSEIMKKIGHYFKQKWYCETKPEITFRISGKSIDGFCPEKVEWSPCMLSTGTRADYSFLERRHIEAGIYVNGLWVEGGQYPIAVNVLEKKEEVSLSLNRNELIGIAGNHISGPRIQKEVLGNELFAAILTCDPFQMNEKFKFRKWGGHLEEQMVFTNKGFCLLGWLNDFEKSSMLYLGYSAKTLDSEEEFSDFCGKMGQEADNLYFTQGRLKMEGQDPPQIRQELYIGNIWWKLGGFVVAKGYFGGNGCINKSEISGTIGLGYSDLFFSQTIAGNGSMFWRRECDDEDRKHRLEKVWENRAGHPVALYKGGEIETTMKRISDFHQICLNNINRYFAKSDRIIPYAMEDRRKKFPEAFRELDLYIKNAEKHSDKLFMKSREVMRNWAWDLF